MEINYLSDVQIDEEYYSGESDLIRDFYKPCLELSQEYDRSVGYFRSSVFLLIGPEIIKFAKRGGKIRLICSPSFSSSDLDAISSGYLSRYEGVASQLDNDIQDMVLMPELKYNISALATLVKFGVLEIKIAFMPNSNGLYHAKLGLLRDHANNCVVFKGSVNESWSGWHERGNHESLDVFASWKGGRDERQVDRDSNYFERLWSNHIPSLEVLSFPEVSKEKLTQFADKSVDDIDPYKLTDFYKLNDLGKGEVSPTRSKRTPLKHQIDALKAWEKQGSRGILEHATGSGKTFTALTALKQHLASDGVALVLVPDRLLHKQWAQEIKEELPSATVLKAGDGFDLWKKNLRLKSFSSPLDGGGPRIILTTMATARTDEFCNNIHGGDHLMMIADEVHEVGSSESYLVYRRLTFLRELANEQTTWIFTRSTRTRCSLGINQ